MVPRSIEDQLRSVFGDGVAASVDTDLRDAPSNVVDDRDDDLFDDVNDDDEGDDDERLEDEADD